MIALEQATAVRNHVGLPKVRLKVTFQLIKKDEILVFSAIYLIFYLSSLH